MVMCKNNKYNLYNIYSSQPYEERRVEIELNDVNIFNDSNNMKHSKLSNNPNALHEEGKPNSIELIEDITSKKTKKINNKNKIYMSDSAEDKINNDDIKDENNINNINTSSNEEDIEKIDDDSIHSYNSHKKKENSINQKIENNTEKNEDNKSDENKDGDKDKGEQKNDLIIDEEENNKSKKDSINDYSEGMKENNY